MNEMMGMGPSPEELKKKQEEEEDAEWLAGVLSIHPEWVASEKISEPVYSSEDLESLEKDIAEFENMCASFEEEYSLAELHKIIDLTPQEAPLHPLRGPARLALNPIFGRLTALEKILGKDTDRYRELDAQYLRLSHAVGRSRGVIIVHDSPYTPR